MKLLLGRCLLPAITTTSIISLKQIKCSSFINNNNPSSSISPHRLLLSSCCCFCKNNNNNTAAESITSSCSFVPYQTSSKKQAQAAAAAAAALSVGAVSSYYSTGSTSSDHLLNNKSIRNIEMSSSLSSFTNSDNNNNVIIVGAGVAGSALAHTLAKDGRKVHVIERDLKEPDRIVGEVLQPGGYLKLIELGLQDCVEGIDAQEFEGYAVFKDGKNARLAYDHTQLAGRSFHNGRFIQRMRQKAASLPNVRMEQGSVTSLIKENGTVKGVHYKTKYGQKLEAYAPLTIVCDGCFSNLRDSLCNPKVEVLSHFVGLILENCELPFAKYGHVIMADPSPILFYQISSTEVRCLVDVPVGRAIGGSCSSNTNSKMAQYLKSIVAPQVPAEIRGSFIEALEKGVRIRSMANKSMPTADPPPATPGALVLGDALNIRHPITGGGMTVALFDILLLRRLLNPLPHLSHAPNNSFFNSLQSFYTLRKPVATTINTLASTVYKVLSASPEEGRKEMHEACFEYLRLATAAAGSAQVLSSGPLLYLLSGMNPSPWNLVLYSFPVGLYGVGRLLLPFPTPHRIWAGLKLISSVSHIILPIIKAEGLKSQLMF